MLSVSLILPGESDAIADISELPSGVSSAVDAIIDSGSCGIAPTSVIDVTSDVPKVIRIGKGSVVGF